MKIKKVEEPKEFTPLTINLTFETPAELRLFYHVCNRSNLKEVLGTPGYDLSKYNLDVASKMQFNPEDFDFLEDYLNDQGLKL